MQQIIGPPALETLRPDQLQRRQRVIDAALRAIARTDYDDWKMSDVTKDSGVALGTIYRYFVSKEHLAAVALMEWQSALESKLGCLSPTGASEQAKIEEVFRHAIKAFQLQPRFHRTMVILQSTSDPYAAAIVDSLESIFRHAVEVALGGKLTDDQETTFMTVTCVLDGSLNGWISGKLSIKDVYERVERSIELIYRHQPLTSVVHESRE